MLTHSISMQTGKGCHMADSQTIAILLKHEHKLDDALHYAALLIDSGARVAFYCLCRRRCRSGIWNVLPLLDTEAACYTDNPRLAMDNVIVTGHAAGTSVEGTEDWQNERKRVIEDLLAGYWPINVVNPEVQPKVQLHKRVSEKHLQ